MKTRMILTIMVAVATAPVIAQQTQCPDLAKTLKEYQIDTSSSSVLNNIYSQHCQADGTIRSSSAGLDLNVVVKAIPVSLSGSSSSSSQQMSQFCKTYSSQYQSSSQSDGYKEKITSEALNTINQCLQLQSTGLLMTHNIVNSEAVAFYMRKQATNNFEIRGVRVTGPVSCQGQMGKGSVKAFDESIFGPITSVSFTCTRRGTPSGKDTYFPEATITVMTDQANYSVFWPQGTRLSPSMAEAVAQQISSVQAELTRTNAALSPLLNAKPVQLYQCPSGNTPGWGPGGSWGSYGCQGQISTTNSCTNIEYPHTDTRPCQAIGVIRPQ